METLVFYLFGAILVVAAGLVITVRNPVHAALFLVLAFFSSAALWLLLEAEFLAIALVLVYVGAVMVLFLFVVMMLDVNLTKIREGFIRYLPVGAGVAVLMVIAITLAVGSAGSGTAKVLKHGPDYSNTRELGLELFTNYLYPFEIAGVVLVVAIIAAIALTMREKRQTKTQKPEEQVAVKARDRVRVVKVPAASAISPSPQPSPTRGEVKII